MRLLVCGDCHGNIRHAEYLIETALEQSADAIVQVGDWGFTWPGTNKYAMLRERLIEFNVPMYWVDGNHDNFTDLKERGIFEAREPQQMDDQIWYLPRGSRWEWGGVRFMALGGGVSIDKSRRISGLSWWEEELVTEKDIERATRGGTVDVLLTHDAPSGVRPLEKFLQQQSEFYRVGYKIDAISQANREKIRRVCDATNPGLVIHGHYHHRYIAGAPWQSRSRVLGLARDDSGPLSWVILDTDNPTSHPIDLLSEPRSIHS